MTMTRRLRISRGGQVSIPSRVRQRWATSTVLADDQGDRLVLRPAPDDPIEAAVGAFAEEGRALRASRVTFEEIRQEEREAETEIEDQRWRR